MFNDTYCYLYLYAFPFNILRQHMPHFLSQARLPS